MDGEQPRSLALLKLAASIPGQNSAKFKLDLNSHLELKTHVI